MGVYENRSRSREENRSRKKERKIDQEREGDENKYILLLLIVQSRGDDAEAEVRKTKAGCRLAKEMR